MKDNQTSSSFGKITFYFGVGLFLISVYNNCSSKLDGLPGTHVDSQQTVQYFSKIAQDHFSPEVCQDAESWSCSRAIIAPGESSEELLAQEEQQQDCVTIDGQVVCPEIKNLFFDSAAAIDKCSDCTEEDILKRYFLVEYQCSNHALRISGINAARGSGPSLQEAMTSARTQCHNLFDGEDSE